MSKTARQQSTSRSPIIGPLYSSDEDDAIRAHYRRGSVRALAAKIGRSDKSVYARAAVLGLTRAFWTDLEDRELKNLWGEIPIRQMASRLRRSPLAVYQRGQELGLSLGVPRGAEYLSLAAARTNFDIATLRRILRWAEVPIRRTMSRPQRGKPWRPHHFVDPFDVNEAIARWMATETLESAAKRLGVHTRVVVRRLQGVKGVPPKPEGKQHWRIPSDVIDRVLGERKAA